VLHNLALAYEQLGRLDEAEASYAEAASRARTDPRVYVGWGIVALKRGDHASAAGRLDRAKELFADKIPPIWFWARVLVAAAAGDFEVGRAGRPPGRRGPSPECRACANNLAVLKELAGDLPEAEALGTRGVARRAVAPTVVQEPGHLAYRNSRYDEAWDLYQRAVELAPDLGDDVTSSSATSPTSGATGTTPRSCGAGRSSSTPKHELVKANLETLSTLS